MAEMPYVFLLMCIFFNIKYTSSSWTYPELICSDRSIMARVTYRVPYYVVSVYHTLNSTTEISVKLDSEGTILPETDRFPARLIGSPDLVNNVFTFITLEDTDTIRFRVVGKPPPDYPPHLISFKINGEEKCASPKLELKLSSGIIDTYWSEAPDKFCGRRKVYKKHKELIVSGSVSKTGKWPWHVALYHLERNILKYRCGGTLLSTVLVLTAAHCVTKRGAKMNVEAISVVLGKYTLDPEATTQEKEVFRIVVHDDFDHKKLNNDIALLKLATEASFNNYVQPACLWLNDVYDQLDSYEINGAVVGWGIDQTASLTNELHETTMPMVADSVCIRYDPVFYSNMLNGKKFCAGFSNGTAACNGDSGGGFVVFVPDARTPSSSYPPEKRPGAWYVKGIVSTTLSGEDSRVCNSDAYTVFTDVAQYRNWILKYLK